jgi:hypothetical protein
MPDSKTQRLVSKWQTVVNAVAQAKDNLALAEDHLSRASAELGNWLTPGDAMSGESFNIWVNGSLLEVTVLAGGTRYRVKYREERREEEQ